MKEMHSTHYAAFRNLGHHFSKMDERGGEQVERVTVSAEGLKAISNTDIELRTLVAYFAKVGSFYLLACTHARCLEG